MFAQSYGAHNCADVCVKVMKEFGVYNIVFSSSCTVYGAHQYLPADELHPTGNCNCPYGRTKHFIEQILFDICNTDKVSLKNLDKYHGFSVPVEKSSQCMHGRCSEEYSENRKS